MGREEQVRGYELVYLQGKQLGDIIFPFISKLTAKKYDNLRRDRKLEFPFYHQLPANPRPADFSASYELLMSDNEHPPVHPDPSRLLATPTES